MEINRRPLRPPIRPICSQRLVCLSRSPTGPVRYARLFNIRSLCVTSPLPLLAGYNSDDCSKSDRRWISENNTRSSRWLSVRVDVAGGEGGKDRRIGGVERSATSWLSNFRSLGCWHSLGLGSCVGYRLSYDLSKCNQNATSVLHYRCGGTIPPLYTSPLHRIPALCCDWLHQ